jgi:hypothetical protein
MTDGNGADGSFSAHSQLLIDGGNACFLVVAELHGGYFGCAAFIRSHLIITTARILHLARGEDRFGFAPAGVDKDIQSDRQGQIHE